MKGILNIHTVELKDKAQLVNVESFKGKYLYFVDYVLISHKKNVNDVNIFIMKYKYLEMATKVTKSRIYANH